MSRPILFPERCIVLAPELCAGVESYVAAWAVGDSWMDWERPFDKRQKETHRLTIADTRGPLQLTVPIVKPHTSRVKWSDIEVSTHGAWWDVHRVALESAYGRTPYFEFYIDRLLPMLTAGVTDRFPRLWELGEAWDREIRGMLGISRARNGARPPGSLGEGVETSAPIAIGAPAPVMPRYRQVRERQLGFIPGLSVLDLIFNLGPEAQIYLDRVARIDARSLLRRSETAVPLEGTTAREGDSSDFDRKQIK